MADQISVSSIRAKYPQYADLSDDQLLIGLHQKYYSDMPAGEFFNRIDYDTRRAGLNKDVIDATGQGTGTGPADMQREQNLGIANIGAGMTNLGEGAKQLWSKYVPGAAPYDMDELRETRKRDAALAASQRGGGLYQAAGETLPLMALPVGGLAARGVLGAAAGGAGSAAAGAALTPVDEAAGESRGQNMQTAAMLGAVLPGAGNLAAKGARYGGRLLTDEGARMIAAQQIASRYGGQEGAQVLRQTLDNLPQTRIPMTAAQATGDAQLAAAEAASRARPGTQPGWADYDAQQNAAKWDALRGMTPSDLRVQRLDAVRQGRTAPMRQGALDAAAQTGGYAEPVTMYTDALLAGDTGANPAVKSIGNYVKGALGDNPTPGRLYETRKVLADKLSGRTMIGDELGSAAKSAQRETRALIGVIDDALDSASSGQWKPYMSEYAARSQPVTSGRVLQQAVGELEQKPLIGTTQVSTPQITSTGFGKALDTEGRYGNRLTPQAQADTSAFNDELRQIETAARTRKLAGTMGGGSNTAMDTVAMQDMAAKILQMVPGGKVLTKAGSLLKNINAAQVEEHMAKMLQSPTALGAALRALPPDQLSAVTSEVMRGAALAVTAR